MLSSLDPVIALAAMAALALGGALTCGLARFHQLGHALAAVGAALIGIAGAARLVGGSDASVPLGRFQGISPSLRLDSAAATLWILTAAVALPALAHAAADRRQRSVVTLALLVLAGAVTAVAADAHTLAIAWATAAIAVAFVPREGSEPGIPAPGVLTQALAAIVALAMALAAQLRWGGGLTIDALSSARTVSPLATCLFAAAALALAGVAPFHRSRLDLATRASGPALALLYGVVPASAVVLMMRGTTWLAKGPPWIAWALAAWLVIATLHALALALTESRLPRAVSSVIGAGVGSALLTLTLAVAFAQAHRHTAVAEVIATSFTQLLVLALVAAAAQLAVASIVARSGDDMHLHGGILRRMPGAGATLLVALVGLAALPPFAGFSPMSSALRAAISPMPASGVPHPLGAVVAIALAVVWSGTLAVTIRIVIASLVGPARTEPKERLRDQPRGQRAALAMAAALTLIPVIGAVPVARVVAEVTNDLLGHSVTSILATAAATTRDFYVVLLLAALAAALSVRTWREVAHAWSGGLQPTPTTGISVASAQPYATALPEFLEARYDSEVTPGLSEFFPAEIRTTVRFASRLGARLSNTGNQLRALLSPLLQPRVSREAQLALWVAAAIALALTAT